MYGSLRYVKSAGRHGAVGRGRRKGAILLPVIAMMATIVLAVGVFLLLWLEALVLEATAVPAAQSVAAATLRTVLRPASARVGGEAGMRDVPWPAIEELAAVNGIGRPAFEPLDRGDIRLDGRAVEVTIRARRRGRGPYRAGARAVPAGVVTAGTVLSGDAGQPVRTIGCLPLGIAAAELAGAEAGRRIELRLTGESPNARCVRLPGAKAPAAAYAAYLAGSSRAGSPDGAPPPAVAVGDRVVLEEDAGRFLDALARCGPDGCMIVPLLDGARITGFGLVHIEAVDRGAGAVAATVAPAAVMRGAMPRGSLPAEAGAGQLLAVRLEG